MMASDTGSGQPVDAALADEDRARANLYGLVGRLFYGPADPNLLAEISRETSPAGGDGPLPAAWQALQRACRSAYPALVRQEYDTLFVGVGKAEVTPYLSAYSVASAPDRYLVELRRRLAGWGLSRQPGAFEPEDHVSGLADVMRWLIEAEYPLREQRLFFGEFVDDGALKFCAAVQNAASASFYKAVATFAAAYYELERAAFEMSDSD